MEPQGSGNVGAVARAMKNMGFSRLTLVNPQCKINEESMNFARSANDILENAKIFSTLKEALYNFQRVVGTTCRLGKDRSGDEPISPREYVTQNSGALASHNTAIVFGRENKGLSGDELMLCNDVLTIPTFPELASLNLAQSVMIILYEIFLGIEKNSHKTNSADIADFNIMDGLFGHLEKILELIDFFEGREHKYVLIKIREYFSKYPLTSYEAKLFRGFLHKIECKINLLEEKIK